MASFERFSPRDRIFIRRYARDRFYDTTTMSYVSLAQIHAMLRAETEVEIVDASSGVNITALVLAPRLH
jgi:polyhydroxyalkanoate synthesis regulator protein